MKNMKKTLYASRLFLMVLLASVAFFVSVVPVSYANTPTNQFKTIYWKEGSRYTNTGSLHLATHITFPVPKSADPVVGNSELWNIESAGNHVFLKPHSTLDAGKTTTLTFIGQNNRSYEFLLKRVDQPQTTCFIIEDNGALLNGSWKDYQSPEQQRFSWLQAQMNTQKAISENTQKQIIIQQRKALKAYRKNIYTDYTWTGKRSKNNVWHNKIINSVYDDSRWTYIRLNADNQGVMAIYGLLAKQQTLLESQYDASGKIYQVAGIYPELVLVYNRQQIRITRRS